MAGPHGTRKRWAALGSPKIYRSKSGETSTLRKDLQQLHGHPPANRESLKAGAGVQSGVVNQKVPVGQEPWTASSREAECGCWSPGAHLEPRALVLGPAAAALRPFFSSLQLSLLSCPPGPLRFALRLRSRLPDLHQGGLPTPCFVVPQTPLATNARMWKWIQESCGCAVELLFSRWTLLMAVGGAGSPAPSGGPCPQACCCSRLGPAGACLLWGRCRYSVNLPPQPDSSA